MIFLYLLLINITSELKIRVIKPPSSRDKSLNIKYTQMEFIEGKYLNKKHNQYCKLGVYECLYMIILTIYFEDSKYEKIKYQKVDTTFIKNEIYKQKNKKMDM